LTTIAAPRVFQVVIVRSWPLSDPSDLAAPRDSDVQAALREYLERVDRGEVVDRESFLSQHSEIAEKLRSFIAAEEQFRRLAGAERVDSSTQSFTLDGQETIAPRAGATRSAKGESSGLKQEFGRYRIQKALGKGAMGMVYLAEDTQLRRQVVLKRCQEPFPEGEGMIRLRHGSTSSRRSGRLRVPRAQSGQCADAHLR
jgi:hypothetical protein